MSPHAPAFPMEYTLTLIAFLFALPVASGQGEIKLLASDGAADDSFGCSVAISGGAAIVGALNDDDNGSESGSAYLFDTTTGNQIDKLLPSDGAAEDHFGYSVAISDTTAIVGAYGDDDNGSSSGSAYLYCECLVESYCVTSPNSAGAGAVMGVTGSAFISQNDLVLVALSCPANQFGIFYYGTGQAQVSFGNGYRCVSPGGVGLYRFPPVSTGSLGQASYAVDNTNPPQPSGQITAGSTWNFQFWYRDPAAGGAYFNLSDGLEVTFCP